MKNIAYNEYKKKSSVLVNFTHTCSRFCTNCGSPLEADDFFCSECGNKIELDESTVNVASVAKIEDNGTDNPSSEEHASVVISPDRLASILQTNRIKTGEEIDESRRLHRLPGSLEKIGQVEKAKLKETAVSGYYVHEDSDMTQYLVIDTIQGNYIKASVKTLFANGGYSCEFYEGNLSGDDLHLHIVDSDLHPPPDELVFFSGSAQRIHHIINLSENFDGIVNDKKIIGSFAGHFNKYVVFRKC